MSPYSSSCSDNVDFLSITLQFPNASPQGKRLKIISSNEYQFQPILRYPSQSMQLEYNHFGTATSTSFVYSRRRRRREPNMNRSGWPVICRCVTSYIHSCSRSLVTNTTGQQSHQPIDLMAATQIANEPPIKRPFQEFSSLLI